MMTRVGGSTDLCDNDLAETTLLEVEPCPAIPFEIASPAGVVSADAPQGRGGVSVPENVWFKHWAKKSLVSEDLNSLSDHEERVWWRFLSVASSQEPRWTVTYSLKLTEAALARSCASTPPKLRAALERFEAMGMLTAIDGGWQVTNWEKHQETPAAKRKREQRERDRYRDIGRDMSQDSHAGSHAPLLRARGQRTEDRSVEPKGSPEGAPPKRRPSKSALIPLTSEERGRLVEEFPYPTVNDQIDLALAHESHLKYPTGQYLYVRNWLRRTDWTLAAPPKRQVYEDEGIFSEKALREFREREALRAE